MPPLPTLVPGAPGLDDLLALARARHLLTVAVGQAQVTLGLRSAGVLIIVLVLWLSGTMGPGMLR